MGTLALFDVLGPVDGRYSYVDLVTARAVGQLFSSGVVFPKIIAAALALERQGERLSNVRLAGAPWGAVLKVLEGTLAEIDGQFLLQLEGSDLDADGVFALAEESEQDGDLVAARRWYELAARLDATDPVIPFNLGNVLDELGFTREAEIAYRQAIARSPDMADAWFNLGLLRKRTSGNQTRLRATSAPLRSTRLIRTPFTTPPSCICAGASLWPLFSSSNKSSRRRPQTPEKSDASRISAGLRPRQQRHANKLTPWTLRLRNRRLCL